VAYIRTDASPNEVLPTQCNPPLRELSSPCTPMRRPHPGAFTVRVVMPATTVSWSGVGSGTGPTPGELRVQRVCWPGRRLLTLSLPGRRLGCAALVSRRTRRRRL
jgi:hypothetical protein